MIFAAATDDKSLMVFGNAADVIAYCECIDVEDGRWRFWNEAGVALAPEILTPCHRDGFVVGSGDYRLVVANHLSSLSDCLATLASLERNVYFPTIASVRAHLANIAQVPPHGS